MSVQEIKEQLATLPRQDQDEVVAYLFHLRHREDPEYTREMDRRLGDRNPGNWLSIEDFEAALNQKIQNWVEPYRVFLHLDLLECIPSKGRQKNLILDFVRLLASEPKTLGDFAHRDESQREQQVKIVGDCAVTYWVDEPVKTVMIVGIRHADR